MTNDMNIFGATIDDLKPGLRVSTKDAAGKVQGGTVDKVKDAGPGSTTVFVKWDDGSGESVDAGKLTVTAAPPPAKPQSLPLPRAGMSQGVGLATAVAGAYFWKEHRVLGFLGGYTAGSTGYDLATKDIHPMRGAGRVGVAGTAIAGALLWEKQPVAGFLGGLVVGAVASYFVPGASWGAEFAEKWKGALKGTEIKVAPVLPSGSTAKAA